MQQNIAEHWLFCTELPEEKDRGVVLSLQTDDVTQDTMFTVG